MLALETLLAAVGGILLGLGLGLTLGRRRVPARPPARVESPPSSSASSSPGPQRADATLALSDTVPVEGSRAGGTGGRTVSHRPPARREG